MNRRQRKTHKILWIIFGVLIPLGFIAAIIVLPDSTPEVEFKINTEIIE